MGNCIQQGGGGAVAGEGRPAERSGRRSRRSSGGDGDEDHGAAAAPSVVKVKVVLTKGELGWLVARLKAGDRRIEDVLHEVARKREGRAAAAAGDGWRPSLESIVECSTETAETACGGGASSDD